MDFYYLFGTVVNQTLAHKGGEQQLYSHCKEKP